MAFIPACPTIGSRTSASPFVRGTRSVRARSPYTGPRYPARVLFLCVASVKEESDADAAVDHHTDSSPSTGEQIDSLLIDNVETQSSVHVTISENLETTTAENVEATSSENVAAASSENVEATSSENVEATPVLQNPVHEDSNAIDAIDGQEAPTHGSPDSSEDSVPPSQDVEAAQGQGSEQISDETTAKTAESSRDQTGRTRRGQPGRGPRRGGPRPKRVITLKLEDMTVGMELEGTVKSIMAYGAFIGDMGTPTDGLLHVSQLSNNFVENVSDVLSVDDKVKVRVLSVDLEKGNFSLSMKPPRVYSPPPVSPSENEPVRSEMEKDNAAPSSAPSYSRRSERYSSEAPNRAPSSGPRSNPRRGGDSSSGPRGGSGSAAGGKWKNFTFDPQGYVDAKVTSVAEFGAFCRILGEDGQPDESFPTDGLIHISELSEERVSTVASVLAVDQVVKARVTAADKKRNRISLSLKAYKPDEAVTLAEDMAANSEKQPEFMTSMQIAFERAAGRIK